MEMFMKLTIRCVLAFVMLLASFNFACAADITILHSIPSGTNDGFGFGYDSLTYSGSTLYGSTESGGAFGGGTLYKMQLDGSQYQTIASLSDGPCPYGVTLDGSTIFGTNLTGGPNGWGLVYRIETNGTGYQQLHSFTRANGDGAQMYSGVAMNSTRLFGSAVIGGSDDNGIVFSIAKDGTDYRIIHTFTGGNDGYMPYGEPTVDGNVLYGMSSTSIYKMNLDGSGFQVLKPNVGGIGKLTLSGSTLYGMAGGTAFRMGTDGSSFTVLHQLEGQSQSGFALVGSTLYGMTRWGGSADKGTIFSIDTNGSNYQVLHTFVGGVNDGGQPLGDPIVIGSTLYGTVSGGPNGGGIVFSMPVPEPSTFALLFPAILGGMLWRRRSR
jgi:uncharacterized repeat protein (TIGR03803 family)